VSGPQQPIELILARQLAAHLAMPIVIFDSEGTLLFYNKPAEAIYGGRPFPRDGKIPWEEWIREVRVFNEDGSPMASEERPVPVVLRERRPVHRRMRLQGFDGRVRPIEATAFPLEGQSGRHLGGVIIFWEREA